MTDLISLYEARIADGTLTRDDAQEAVLPQFERIRAESGLLLVSHNPGTIRRFCDTGLVLRHGRLTIFDGIDEAVDYYLSDG